MTKTLKYWDYPFSPSIPDDFQLDLDQGNTPLEDAPEEIKDFTNFENLKFKREDLNPNGSFKDRALAYQMSLLHKSGEEYCVLSSSGNAAISCCAFAQLTNIKPIVLVSPNISENKLSQIIAKKPHILIQSKQARRLANYIHRKHNTPILNPSKDPHATIGFETLGWEIYNQYKKCDAIFSYSTSGASLLGIYNYFKKNNLKSPRLFASKISYSTPPSEKFYNYPNSKNIIKMLEKSNGGYHYTFQPETNKTLKLIEKESENISSLETASTITLSSKLNKRFKNSENKIKNPLIIISGKKHKLLDNIESYPMHYLETKEEIDKLLKEKC